MNRSAAFDAAKALLTAPLVAHDTDAPLDSKGQVVRSQYVVLVDLSPDLTDDRLSSPQNAGGSGVHRILARSVGITPFAVREVDRAVAAKWCGARPSVAGRRVAPMRCDEFGPVLRDTDVSPPLYFIESEYSFDSSPA